MKVAGVWLKLPLLALGVALIFFIINAAIVLAANNDHEIIANKTTEAHIEVEERAEPARVLRRGKRYLDFTKGTRISWRTTVKNNILKVNTLWGYGFGFRANFPFPDKADRLRPFFKRDVFHAMEKMMDGHGFDGRGCLLKSFCTAILDVESQMNSGMLFKLLKLIFSVLVLLFTYSLPSHGQSQHLASNGIHLLQRGKRYLDFLDTSRMFFRLNSKINIIPQPQIWANAYGFRVNIPIEFNKKYRPYKRDTYEVLHELMDKHGFDGQACVLKAFCTVHIEPTTREGTAGVLFKLLKYVFTLNDEERRFFSYLRKENCAQLLHNHCPLSFNSISPYTDDV